MFNPNTLQEKEGRFRKDLLFRLRTINIELPPLRRRGDDIQLIANDYIARYCEKKGIPPKQISSELMEALYLYDWPGNVRELVNVLENSLSVIGDDSLLYPDHLPMLIRAKIVKFSISSKDTLGEGTSRKLRGTLSSFKIYREEVVREAEKIYMKDLMDEARWDIQKAGEISELSRARIYGLLKKHGISKSR